MRTTLAAGDVALMCACDRSFTCPRCAADEERREWPLPTPEEEREARREPELRELLGLILRG